MSEHSVKKVCTSLIRVRVKNQKGSLWAQWQEKLGEAGKEGRTEYVIFLLGEKEEEEDVYELVCTEGKNEVWFQKYLYFGLGGLNIF